MSSVASGTARCWRGCKSCRAKSFIRTISGGSTVVRRKGLVLAHLWFAFGAFALAAALGVWQMWVRSPLHAPYADPQNYFLSVTAHGTSMAYVLTTFFVMGFGYFVAETALRRAVPGVRWAWLGFLLAFIGTLMAVVTVFA